MDFEPGPEERAATERAVAFVADVLPTLPEDCSNFSRRATLSLGERGFLREPSTLLTVLAVAEMARASGSLGVILSHDWLFADALGRFGGSSPLIASARRGATLGCVALLDTASAAPADGVHFDDAGVLSGTLPLVLGGGTAEHAVVFCQDASDANPRLMLVDLGASGIGRSPQTSALGLGRAPKATLHFTAVAPSAGVVLAQGDAAVAANRGLIDARRILTGAVALGLARRALEAARAHLQGRRSAQSTDFLVSDILTVFDAAWVSVLNASWLRDAGTGHAVESAGAKLIATRAATKITHDAIGVCGESTEDDGLKRAYLDARILEMHAGTEAMQIDTMASTMLGEF